VEGSGSAQSHMPALSAAGASASRAPRYIAPHGQLRAPSSHSPSFYSNPNDPRPADATLKLVKAFPNLRSADCYAKHDLRPRALYIRRHLTLANITRSISSDTGASFDTKTRSIGGDLTAHVVGLRRHRHSGFAGSNAISRRQSEGPADRLQLCSTSAAQYISGGIAAGSSTTSPRKALPVDHGLNTAKVLSMVSLPRL